MTRVAVAKKLGISHSLVAWIEITALRKIAPMLGLEPPPIPKYLEDQFGRTGRSKTYKCGRCGAFGHNKKTCVGAVR